MTTAIVVSSGLIGIVFLVLLGYGIWCEVGRQWQWWRIQRQAIARAKALDKQWAKEQRRWHEWR